MQENQFSLAEVNSSYIQVSRSSLEHWLSEKAIVKLAIGCRERSLPV